MQDYNVRGTIVRILSKSAGVFIFVFRTIEEYPVTLKAKKFKPQDMGEEDFLAACEPFAVDQTVFIRNSRLATERVKKDGQIVTTTDGHDVFAPVIVINFLGLETASIHHAPKPASTPDQQAPAQSPAAARDASRRPAPAPVPMPAPAPQPVENLVESNDDIPRIPF